MKTVRHPLHAICPYFAMFPESFVKKHVLAYTRPGDIVFDPFVGRGTTVFESLINDREAAGVDINPVAACIAGAKGDPPSLKSALLRLRSLEETYENRMILSSPRDEFFQLCFHGDTLNQIMYLRETLNWRTSKIDRFLAAIALGCLHGESHRSPNYLSNRMPRTISTKPKYSVRWWKEHNSLPPKRDAFEILRTLVSFRLSQPVPNRTGVVKQDDARNASIVFSALKERVSLIVTSPPYLDTTDYREDQWLRLWFLGGSKKPSWGGVSDDRHTITERYWAFLSQAWAGVLPLLRRRAVIVIRIGGKLQSRGTILENLLSSFRMATDRRVTLMQEARTSEIRNSQLTSFRPGKTGRRVEHDFVFRIA